MKITKLTQGMTTGLAMMALSLLAAPAGQAACAATARNASTFLPLVGNLQDPTALDPQGSPEQSGSPDGLDGEKNDSGVLGLWKVIYLAGGVLNDVGFQQFNAGGTELLNDVGALDAGNNFCIGAWKKVGDRTYATVHPFFIFDSSGKTAIAVGIEEQRMIVAPDGNTFSGTWTQDNYDFSGKLIPGNHFNGTVKGTRIAPGFRFPFPIP